MGYFNIFTILVLNVATPIELLTIYPMATDSLQIQLRSFLRDPEQKRMVIHFPNLQIKTFQHAAFLHTLSLCDRRLRFVKTKVPKLLRIQVLDNLVFRFSFVFSVDFLY